MSRYEKKDYNHVYVKLQDYMFSNNLFERSQYTSYVNGDVNGDNIEIEKPMSDSISLPASADASASLKDNFFIPDEIDKLFWCFYIIHFDFETYYLNKNSFFTIEKEFKINAITEIRKKKKLFKEKKLRLSEIEDELLNHQKITLKGLYALCLLYNKNILYAWDNKYFEIMTNPTSKTYILSQINKQDALFQVIKEDKEAKQNSEIYDQKIYFYRTNYWKIDNISKPLRGFSVYSLKELQEICNKLNIPVIEATGKKKTKKEIYQDIVKKL